MRATRKPLPPPPPTALQAIGKPISSAAFIAASTLSSGAGVAGDDRHVGRLHDLAGAGLRTHRIDRVGRRADPGDVGLADPPGELGVLGEKPVARVDRVGAGLLGNLEDLVDVQVALGRHGGAEQEGLVGEAHVRSLPICLRVDGDRADSMSFRVRMTRIAISPRLATRTFSNIDIGAGE